MKILITESGNQVVGVIGNWTGPVPQKGDYIEHPPLSAKAGAANVMTVRCVTYRMLTRPGGSEGHFTGHPEPHIEISV